MTGQVVTFYSYKGGSGRSMAVANVAWVLATNGKKVLVIDWDIEAPGLHRYFLPLMRSDPDLKRTEGLIDRLWAYVDLLLAPKKEDAGDPLDLADLRGVAQELNLPSGAKGSLHFVPAGRQDGEYGARSQGFDWAAFYQRFGGAAFIARMRETLTAEYHFVLIDSRTGLSDTSGVCTVELPDTVVHCFVHNRQSVLGIVATAESIARQQPEGRAIRQYPVPMRVEKNVPDYEGNWQFARDRLDDLLSGLSTEEKELYWAQAEVLYRARYAGGETLAAIADRPGERNTLLADMLWLAREVSGLTDLESIRLSDGQRETYQRAVELRDPREAELKTFARNPGTSYTRLLEWLEELRREGVDSLSWVERLTAGVLAASDDLAVTDQVETALDLLECAIDTYRPLVDKRASRLAPCLSNLLLRSANIYLRKERFDAAGLAAQECVAIWQSLSNEKTASSKASLAEALSTLARVHLLKHENKSAQKVAREAINLLDDSVLNIGTSVYTLSFLYATLMKSLSAEKDFKGLKESYEETRKIFEKAKKDEIILDIPSVYNVQMAICEIMGDFGNFEAIADICRAVKEVYLSVSLRTSSATPYFYYSLVCETLVFALGKTKVKDEAFQCTKECLQNIRPIAEREPLLFREVGRRLLDRYTKLAKAVKEEIDQDLVDTIKRIAGPLKRARKPANKHVPIHPESV
ncbi:hypothetical protein TSH7_28445 [Azospirillum sp. TSH7]|uniref:KGGVGR-motif variant AAA ATPase n=1 Tax=unclassified Azospirillum TaxID=2630922 RepID=UPI000D615F23|nr:MULTISPECIES: AAA family ATPase [unclassified Azospirillum]PWC56304.1 hypothetical protein TSH7_28445 [Azospirillum sp. TSH7]PWC61793.1 hypothetical protein TSH20_22920 [Azospirillum sp. TSH20]